MNTSDLLKTAKNIYAVGRNYAEHIEELGNTRPVEPVLFSKSISGLCSDLKILLPGLLEPVHFELELVLRLGRDLDLREFRSLDCISHMALGVDFTARQLQERLKNEGLPWFRAKNFHNACFLGPLREVFALEEPLHFQLFQNGIPRQEGDTRLMLFSFDRILRFLNQTVALREGDLIFTGTPSGVGPVADGDRLRLCCRALQTDVELQIAYDAPESAG